MQDPLRHLLGRSLDDARIPWRESEQEIIDYRDRVAFAASVIRNHELRLWFERDWPTARRIQEFCPECLVMSVPTPALWIDRLDEPPPWRRRGRGGPRL